MNRELFLSLGITILTSATLFMYFRQRFKNIEHKVNTIFQMVQEHAKLQQMQPPQMPPMVNRMMQHIPQMGVHSGRNPTSEELIEVSDDETSDSDASDEESDDETASETVMECYGNHAPVGILGGLKPKCLEPKWLRTTKS